jgi:dipeptidyl aminopeptidase/acylaminoacyl peptidase
MASGRTTWIAAAIAVAVVASCGDDSEPTTRASEPTSTPTPARTATATPEQTVPPDAPPARKVRFRATDGEPVAGEYTPAGRDAPALVLLHDINGGPSQWERLIPYLHDRGFAALAYRSRPSALESERLPDAMGALRWLRARGDVGRRRLGLVGSSIGASTAVLAMATKARESVDAAVALLPVDSSDIWALQDDDRYRPHDILFVADYHEAVSAQEMLDGAVRSKFLQSEEPGHGVTLLGERGVQDALLAWLDERVR